MLEHELFQWIVLKEGLKVRTGEERIGRETDLPTLEREAGSCALDAHGREMTDALLLLLDAGKITLQKVTSSPPPHLTYAIWDYAECSQGDFFAGRFNICVTPKGAAYFNELDARVRAMIQAVSGVRPEQKRIGFHS